MRPELIAPAVAAFFVLLAAIFLVLSATRGSLLARKSWRRIGIIFALVALLILAFSRNIT
jgi:hypothetical protein